MHMTYVQYCTYDMFVRVFYIVYETHMDEQLNTFDIKKA